MDKKDIGSMVIIAALYTVLSILTYRGLVQGAPLFLVLIMAPIYTISGIIFYAHGCVMTRIKLGVSNTNKEERTRSIVDSLLITLFFVVINGAILAWNLFLPLWVSITAVVTGCVGITILLRKKKVMKNSN